LDGYDVDDADFVAICQPLIHFGSPSAARFHDSNTYNPHRFMPKTTEKGLGEPLSKVWKAINLCY
jgi:hypothetical protein